MRIKIKEVLDYYDKQNAARQHCVMNESKFKIIKSLIYWSKNAARRRIFSTWSQK